MALDEHAGRFLEEGLPAPHPDPVNIGRLLPSKESYRTLASQPGSPVLPVCRRTTLGEWRSKWWLKDTLIEFLASFCFFIWGLSGNLNQIIPTANPSLTGLSWGIGMMLAVYIGDCAPGHLNPAFTVAFALFRRFNPRKVPLYIMAQVLAGIIAALLASGLYSDALDAYEGGSGIRTMTGPSSTGRLFVTMPITGSSNFKAFCMEVVSTSLIVMAVAGMNEEYWKFGQRAIPPLALGLMIWGLVSTWTAVTPIGFNPARDVGPRIALTLLGYEGGVWSSYNYYALWVPIFGPICGGCIGGFLYDLLACDGESSSLSFLFRVKEKALRST